MGQPCAQGFYPGQQFAPDRHRALCRCRGRGCAIIGHEINKGRICFMTHRRDKRNIRGGHSPRHDLFVQAPEILDRTTAPCRDDQVRPGPRPAGVLTAGLAQRFGSEAADLLFNPAGLRSPMVDEIIAKSLLTESQAEEDMTIRALDRALRYEFVVLPDGYAPDHWVAYWDQYSHPDEIPPYALGTLDFWWFDQDKHDALVAVNAASLNEKASALAV